jgi:hypothetical protein
VPLEVDLAALASHDKRLYDTRRDVNRDAKQLRARLDSMPVVQLPKAVPDVAELDKQLAEAIEINSGIERRKLNREAFDRELEQDALQLQRINQQITNLEADRDELAAKIEDKHKKRNEAEPLPVLIDTNGIIDQLAEARRLFEAVRAAEARAAVAAEFEELSGKSEELTGKLAENEANRKAALAKAEMPVSGLGVDFDDDGAHVMFNGVPFEQASTAEKLRVSTAIAMAANPELRVLRISDGSLLDDKSMSILTEMAGEHDFQLWIELVRPNETTGIILEDGAIVGQEVKPKERKKPAPKAVLVDGEPTLFERTLQGNGAAPTQEEWDALSPARRAFFERQGIKPQGSEQ